MMELRLLSGYRRFEAQNQASIPVQDNFVPIVGGSINFMGSSSQHFAVKHSTTNVRFESSERNSAIRISQLNRIGLNAFNKSKTDT